MHEPSSRREPLTNIPPAVVVLLAVIAVVHLVRQFLSEPDDTWLVLALAFIPDRYAGHAASWPGGWWSAWTSPLTHMVVHGDLAHLVINAASLAAFGSVLARRIGTLRFLAFTVFSGLAGALVFTMLNAGLEAPMIGASGAISGMMAASLRLMFSAIDTAPSGLAGDLVRRAPWLITMNSLAATLRDRRIQSATAVWLVINLLGAYGLGGPPGQAGAVAWEAHVGGYFAGLLGFGLFDGNSKARSGAVLPAAGEEPGG